MLDVERKFTQMLAIYLAILNTQTTLFWQGKTYQNFNFDKLHQFVLNLEVLIVPPPPPSSHLYIHVKHPHHHYHHSIVYIVVPLSLTEP